MLCVKLKMQMGPLDVSSQSYDSVEELISCSLVFLFAD